MSKAEEILGAMPLINGVEYSWGDIVATIGGVPAIGITGIEYDDEQVVENQYGAGRYPISRSKGQVTPTAKIKAYMSEVIGWQAKSPTGRLQDIAPFPIIVSYLPEDGQIVVDKILNCQFKKNSRVWTAGDTKQEVELDLIVSHIMWHRL